MKYTEQEIEEFKIKADKWDNLESKIPKLYCNEDDGDKVKLNWLL